MLQLDLNLRCGFPVSRDGIREKLTLSIKVQSSSNKHRLRFSWFLCILFEKNIAINITAWTCAGGIIVPSDFDTLTSPGVIYLTPGGMKPQLSAWLNSSSGTWLRNQLFFSVICVTQTRVKRPWCPFLKPLRKINRRLKKNKNNLFWHLGCHLSRGFLFCVRGLAMVDLLQK